MYLKMCSTFHGMLPRKNKIRLGNRVWRSRVGSANSMGPAQTYNLPQQKENANVDATGNRPMSRLEGSALGFREST